METQRRHGVRVRPLWGFGWVGWCALVILAGLIALVASGVDLQLEAQRLVGEIWGGDAIARVTVYASLRWLFFVGNVFVFLSLVMYLIARFVAGQSDARFWFGVFIAWAVLQPDLVTASFRALYSRGLVQEWVYYASDFVVILITALLLALACRWWMIACWVLGGGVAGFLEGWLLGYVTWDIPILGIFAPLTRIGCIGAGLFIWARRKRRIAKRVLAGTDCLHCGYDVSETESDVCPECGEVIEQRESGSPA